MIIVVDRHRFDADPDPGKMMPIRPDPDPQNSKKYVDNKSSKMRAWYLRKCWEIFQDCFLGGWKLSSRT